MNLLNLNIPGITKKEGKYFFQEEKVDSINLFWYACGSASLGIELETSSVDDALRMIKKFGFNSFVPGTGYMVGKINVAERNKVGKYMVGMTRFSLWLTVHSPAKEILFNEGKLLSVNCDGEKILELID